MSGEGSLTARKLLDAIKAEIDEIQEHQCPPERRGEDDAREGGLQGIINRQGDKRLADLKTAKAVMAELMGED